ncbi:putative histidine kinase HHK2p [Phyllosticta citriasiana]|uniref:putative histidine kinase HHK2p n=1 Tax=Phyllosticta citriasiana TaxID=595635 RepID=UPI0030FD9537
MITNSTPPSPSPSAARAKDGSHSLSAHQEPQLHPPAPTTTTTTTTTTSTTSTTTTSTAPRSPDSTPLARPSLHRTSRVSSPPSDETPALNQSLGSVPSSTTTTTTATTPAAADLPPPASHPTSPAANVATVHATAAPSQREASASNPALAEIDRLRQAVNAKMVLSQQRAKLGAMGGAPPSPRSLGSRRVSPISEEAHADAIISPSLDAAFSSPVPTGSLTTSTESTESSRTVRGSVPATPAQMPMRTPSYPFPYVPGTTRSWSSSFHQPFTTLSPTVGALNSKDETPRERQMSGVSTPAAVAANFMPPGSSMPGAEDMQYPTPNLYDLTLVLSSEPGLDAWWTAVTNIMTDWYGAERVTLAVPADPTDIENVPWGQKATFGINGPPQTRTSTKMHHQSKTKDVRVKDGKAKETKGKEVKGECVDLTQNEADCEVNLKRSRPKLESRHSFAGHERVKKEGENEKKSAERPSRPRGLVRTASHALHSVGAPDTPNPAREPALPAQFPHVLKQHVQESTFSDPDFSSIGEELHVGRHAEVFPVLRALDNEAHALIDNAGVNRVLERGKLVTLTRDYSSTEPSERDASGRLGASKASETKTTASKRDPPHMSSESRSRASTLGGDDVYRLKLATHYEEYEQYPSSPWAQSPAPSPAIQANPGENPFFAGANVDEESFNPTGSGLDYSQFGPVEAIGVDRASTVTHVPLIHPVLSQVMQPFDAETPADTPAESRLSRHAMSTASSELPNFQRRAPIAILSMLSSTVPYPQNLTQSLKLLAPHLATSFSNAMHFCNAQRQALDSRHRRFDASHPSGFTSGSADTESLDDLLRLDMDQINESATGSMTSPSEYSVRSKNSPGGSIAGTPGWDPSAFGFSSSKHSVGNTPGHVLGSDVVDSYFDAKKKTAGSRSGNTGDTPPPMDLKPASRKVVSILPHEDEETTPKLDQQSTGKTPSKEKAQDSTLRDRVNSPRRMSLRLNQAERDHQRQHSFLHSYGADFSSSFQSLPAATTPLRTPGIPHGHVRSGSMSERPDMPPPSERLLRTIIDSLPVQVFTAAPATGALTWANTKFLVYRGQDSRQVLQQPWDAIHPEDRAEYTNLWTRSLRTGQQFQLKARVKRFDGHYRWFYVRAAPLKDKRQNIVHWIGTNMDVHDQHLAEINAARQQETAASEAKYRALANSSPQIVFAVTKKKGLTFCNSQWLTYSGQSEQEAQGLGFMDFVHPEDIVKCRLPDFDDDCETPKNVPLSMPADLKRSNSVSNDSSASSDTSATKTVMSPGATSPSIHMPQTRLSKLADTGILKVTRDPDGRPSYSTEVRLKSKDGSFHWHLVRILLAEPVLQGEDEEETWYGTCTDINDHKLLEQTLKETMDAKSRFLSNMSHEIRTPLNGITGMVNFLIDSNLTSEQMEHVNIIRSSTEGLRDLINDILDLSKVEAGMITLSMDWLHIRSLIEEVNDLTSAMAINKGLELNYIVEEEVPSMVKGDRFRIRQVLLNVIGNAIKFTQRGEVFVRCRMADSQDSIERERESLVQFDVIDTGSGFTEKEAEFLFKRFSQIDGSSTRQHGGTGLGLAISMQLVELHGGKMKASSVPGKGSTFTFTIKFTLPSSKEQPPPEASSTATPQMTPAAPPSTPIRPSKPASPIKAPSNSSIKAADSASSSASSDPSIRTGRTSLPSTRSSASSFVSDTRPVNINLSLPHDSSKRAESSESNESTSTVRPITASPTKVVTPPVAAQPPMYSILVVCPLAFSRDATVKHVEMTLPKTVPAQTTARESIEECRKMISSDDPVIFTHIVLVLHESKEVLDFTEAIFHSQLHANTCVIVICDLVQKREIMAEERARQYDKLVGERRLRFIFKPLKPSKFAVIFDPQRERELSTDRNENSAQQVAVNQKMVFDDMKRRLGNKGHRVLLVEDNKINQTVLLKLLGKVAIDVETVLDGVECTDAVFAKDHGYYSIILCDLHMPNKDGYQTCREIRQWEKRNEYPHLPIIALSANVLGDVYSQCVDAGFNSYVTKPVDFKELSLVMTRFLDPADPSKPHEFMRPRKE